MYSLYCKGCHRDYTRRMPSLERFDWSDRFRGVDPNQVNEVPTFDHPLPDIFDCFPPPSDEGISLEENPLSHLFPTRADLLHLINTSRKKPEPVAHTMSFDYFEDDSPAQPEHNEVPVEEGKWRSRLVLIAAIGAIVTAGIVQVMHKNSDAHSSSGSKKQPVSQKYRRSL